MRLDVYYFMEPSIISIVLGMIETGVSLLLLGVV